MIKERGARTRALYKWEDEDLVLRRGNVSLHPGEAQWFANEVWIKEGWNTRHSCPDVIVKDRKGRAYCEGRALIVLFSLPKGEDSKVVLIHELVHARGYGDGKQMHPVSFVKKYLELLHRYMGWNYQALALEAIRRGLLPEG
jgi:hypothetical protein